jgi:hypothetical protein
VVRVDLNTILDREQKFLSELGLVRVVRDIKLEETSFSDGHAFL